MPKRKIHSSSLSSSCNPHLLLLVLMIIISVTWNLDRMINHQTLFLQEELVRDSPLDSPLTKNEKSKLESKHHNQNRQLEATSSISTTLATSNATTTTNIATNSSSAPTLIPSPNHSSPPNPSIKSWGCSRTETPLIFVHIGKAGGGSIRMQLALAAQNYTRKNDHWKKPKLDDHYYPMQTSDDDDNNALQRRGRFCHSTYANSHWVAPVVSNDKILKNNITQQHTPFSYRLKSFDGLKYCNATTPFGMAIACPTNYQSKIRKKHMYMSTLCETCDDEYYIEKEFYKIHLHKSEEPEDVMSKHSTRKNLGPVRANIHAALEKLAKPPPPGHTCDMVYTAHNYLGAELNWLPPRYLKEHWWDHSEWKEDTNNKNDENDDNSQKKSLEDYWNSMLRDRTDRRKEAFEFIQTKSNISSLLGGATIDMDRLSAEIASAASTNDDKNKQQQRWCPQGYKGNHENEIQYDRPKQVLGPLDPWDKSRSLYENCGLPIARAADAAFRNSLGKSNENNSNTMLASLHNANYAPIYSSLPVHRVTMLREPFSWLLSRFFWNTENSNNTVCDNFTFPSLWNPSLSWIEYYSLEFLFSLCGNECRVRYEHHMIDIDGIAAQASSNLRISFSVVGLLNETDSFYEMLQKRIRYIHRSDKTDLGPKHKSTHPDKDRCTALYKQEEFREKVRASSPALVALEGVYRVGVQVNRFQKQELERCE